MEAKIEMIFDKPIQIPVTGREYTGDQRDALHALAQFYRALNTRNLELMQQNWANSAEAAMDNPLGGIKRGWSEIKTIYQKLFASEGVYQFEFYDYTLHESPHLFYVVGRERGELNLSGRPIPLAIRTTRVFRRSEDGNWRQMHHHGSLDDPQMLARYQEAVLGRP
jgi:ketosteroid isomerase-like protein